MTASHRDGNASIFVMNIDRSGLQHVTEQAD
jgi:hypothetical protein